MRSSAPTRLSRIMSEIRTVMIDTISSVPRNTPADHGAGGHDIVVEIGFRERQQLA